MTSPDPALSHDLTRARAYHDTCRAALAAMIDGADEQVVIGEDVSASGADAEVLGYRLRSQAKELRELPEGPLFFGRLDFASDAADHAGQRYHIGRLRITEDPAAPPLVVDWRAPVSRAFYQASARAPQGVAVRRRYGWAPGSRGDSADLTGLEDEHLGRGEDRSSAIVAREIERPRVGPMRDIAATIQPEQDDLVRADLPVSVCVQGAPGTGKTAVGLHRAAYLLYTHPQRIRRGGLLVLGPNRTFLSYIAEVLPALGETGVRQSTLAEEIAASRPVTGYDDEAAACLKHDARMAEVLRRALYARVAADGADDLAVVDGSYRWRVGAGELARIVGGVLEERPPYAVGRERVRSRIVRRLQEQAERRAGPQPLSWVRRIERARVVTACLDAVWPKARPEEVVADLLTSPDALARAADGLLSPAERKTLLWARPPRSWKSARWSAADLVLLDEVAGLIEHPEGYGHVVVDEAQDLSPMEARAVARRSAFGSLTVLGDLAQGTTPWAARDWAGLLRHLGKPDAIIVPLTTGYRVPAAVLGLANRLLARLDVAVPEARSLRRDGELRIVDAGADLAGALVTAVRDALAGEGSLGVVAADGDVPAVRRALTGAGIAHGGPEDLAARVTVVPATLVKGLEYDHVVAVEPATIADSEPRGLHRLYVTLTRAVSHLTILHTHPLPF
ncbi:MULTISPECIES: HelD family protein [Streptomyces]|uniref:AAA family ATPase n=2 Tax=Streptomyces TaxID=1883 RepID=A0A2U9P4M0_STRAS|nr:AAA family ATPase [Streptomyces actuosus]AWT44035.1 AAA family ATPase [Streptomyces actuosus]MBM4820821.1 AAA family ATPase [Streptomyces actuosus]